MSFILRCTCSTLVTNITNHPTSHLPTTIQYLFLHIGAKFPALDHSIAAQETFGHFFSKSNDRARHLTVKPRSQFKRLLYKRKSMKMWKGFIIWQCTYHGLSKKLISKCSSKLTTPSRCLSTSGSLSRHLYRVTTGITPVNLKASLTVFSPLYWPRNSPTWNSTPVNSAPLTFTLIAFLSNSIFIPPPFSQSYQHLSIFRN